jgi:hypothetical protein
VPMHSLACPIAGTPTCARMLASASALKTALAHYMVLAMAVLLHGLTPAAPMACTRNQ